MAVTCKAEHRELYAAIDGEVDHHRARKILGELVRQMDLVLPKKLTVDLGGVTFMDSSGIAILLRACRRMGELEGSMQVVNVPEQADKVLRAAGLDRLILMIPAQTTGKPGQI